MSTTSVREHRRFGEEIDGEQVQSTISEVVERSLALCVRGCGGDGAMRCLRGGIGPP
jgi:hypothetical protein